MSCIACIVLPLSWKTHLHNRAAVSHISTIELLSERWGPSNRSHTMQFGSHYTLFRQNRSTNMRTEIAKVTPAAHTVAEIS